MARCPKCECPHVPVINTKTQNWTTPGKKQHTIIRRRRKCRHCKHSFFTQERMEEELMEEQQEIKQDITKLFPPDRPPELPENYPPNPFL